MPKERQRRPTIEIETWDSNFSRGILPRNNYHDKKIPVVATSYRNPKPNRLWRKLRAHLQKRIVDVVKTPLFERETVSEFLWTNNWESGVAFTALAFSASTLFRFPFVCMRFGGGLFFFVYVLIVILVMQPLTFACMIIGRMSKTRLQRYPWFYFFSTGIPLVFLYITLVFITHNNIVLGYSGVYVITQLVEAEPDTCSQKMKRNSNCIPYKDINPTIPNHKGLNGRNLSQVTRLSSDLYFRYHIQGDKWKSGKWFFFSEQEWRYCIGMAVVFLIVLIIVSRNIVSYLSRVIMYGAFVIPVVLIALIIFQLYWEGGTYGLLYYFLNFKWRFLVKTEFWAEAWSLAFFSCLPGYGLISSFATYKASVRGFYYMSWILCITAIFLAGLSFALVATEVGILEKLSAIKSYYAIMSERTSVSYVCLSNVLMKIPTKWPSIIFFTYVNIFGIWSQIVATEVSIGYFIQFCQESAPILRVTFKSRFYVALGIIFVEMCLLTGYGSVAGPFMFHAHFLFGGSWIVCILSFIRIFSATRVYGFDVFLIKIELLMERSPPQLFKTQMRYFLLPLLICGSIPMTLYLFAFKSMHTRRENSPLNRPPAGVHLYGIILNFIPLLMVFWYYRRLRYRLKYKVGPMDIGSSSEETRRLYVGPLKKRHGTLYNDRLLHRRNAYSWVEEGGQLLNTIKSADFLVDISDIEKELKEHVIIQSKQKLELMKLLQKKQAQLRSEQSSQSALVAQKRVRDFTTSSPYFEKYRQWELIRKDTEYLSKLLRNYSLESAFASAQVGSSDDLTRGEYESALMDNLLNRLGHVHTTVATRVSSRNKLVKRLTASFEINEDTLRKLYANHVKELLGKPYVDYMKVDREIWLLADADKKESSVFLPTRDERTLNGDSDILEYALQYEVGTQQKRILHILVVEGKTHSLLSQLPVPSPKIINMSLKSVSNLDRKDKFKKIASFTLSHLYTHEHLKDWRLDGDKNESKNKKNDVSLNITDIDLNEENPTKYSQLIHQFNTKNNTKSRDPLVFLDPKKVCVVVLETRDDEERANFLSHYVDPLESPTKGWLKKPTRRREKINQTIQKIERILDSAKVKKDLKFDLEPDDDVKLVTINDQIEVTALTELRDKLQNAPSDIVYKNDGDDDDDDDGDFHYKDFTMHQDSDENVKAILSEQGRPINLKIHSYHHFDYDLDRMWENFVMPPQRRHSDPGKWSFSSSSSTPTDVDPDYQNYIELLNKWKQRNSLRASLPPPPPQNLVSPTTSAGDVDDPNPNRMLILYPNTTTVGDKPLLTKIEMSRSNSLADTSNKRKHSKAKPPAPAVASPSIQPRTRDQSIPAQMETKRDSKRKKTIDSDEFIESVIGKLSQHSFLANEGDRNVHLHYEHLHKHHYNIRKLMENHRRNAKQKEQAHNTGSAFVYKDKGPVLEVKKKKKTNDH